jgi:hypothetical protein
MDTPERALSMFSYPRLNSKSTFTDGYQLFLRILELSSTTVDYKKVAETWR